MRVAYDERRRAANARRALEKIPRRARGRRAQTRAGEVDFDYANESCISVSNQRNMSS